MAPKIIFEEKKELPEIPLVAMHFYICQMRTGEKRLVQYLESSLIVKFPVFVFVDSLSWNKVVDSKEMDVLEDVTDKIVISFDRE